MAYCRSRRLLNGGFLTIHERASITSALKAMYGLQDSEHASIAQGSSCEESQTRRGRRKEDDELFFIRLDYRSFTYDSDELLNIATGVVLPEDVAQSLVRSTEKSRQQMNAFVEKRINSNTVGFW